MKKKFVLVLACICVVIVVLYAQSKKWTYSFPIRVGYPEMEASQIVGIITGSIFEVFPELKKEYTTDLERKVFKESDEGKRLVNEIAILKDSLMRSDFSLYLTNNTLTEYYIEEQSFLFEVAQFEILAGGGYRSAYKHREYWITEQKKMMNEINEFWFPSLIMRIYVSNLGFPARWLEISVPETKAVQIEKIKSSIDVEILFRLKSFTKKIEQYDYWRERTTYEVLPIAKQVTVRLINKKSGEVMYQKSYSDPD